MKSNIGRSTINIPIRLKLWAVSGGRCELCNKLLYSDDTFGTEANFGEMAHIHAVSEGGPRAVQGMSDAEKNQIENLMLLCEQHHHMIDSKPEDYGDGYLLVKKRQHEERIRQLTGISQSQTCRLVSFFVDISNVELIHPDKLFLQAAALSDLYPLQDPVIALHSGMKTRYVPNRESMESQAHDLDDAVKRWQRELAGGKDAVALFSLAPQPLLFKLGTLVSDQLNVSVFQCHRNGHKWAWPLGDNSIVEFISKKTKAEPGEIALVIDLSAEVIDERITDILGDQLTIYHLTTTTPNPGFVRNPGIQDHFVESFRSLLETIRNENPEMELLHIFPVMPNSLAIRAGMAYMSKADVPLILYEQAGYEAGFFPALNIGG